MAFALARRRSPKWLRGSSQRSGQPTFLAEGCERQDARAIRQIVPPARMNLIEVFDPGSGAEVGDRRTRRFFSRLALHAEQRLAARSTIPQFELHDRALKGLPV